LASAIRDRIEAGLLSPVLGADNFASEAQKAVFRFATET